MDETSCGSRTNRRFGGTYHLHHHTVKRISELGNLMNEAVSSYETLVPTRATRRYIPEDGILQGKGTLLESAHFAIRAVT
jgi:hypothetical protein